MRIDKLELENFRCFEQGYFAFNPGFNVFIGDNAKGKTALLDALAIAASAVFLGIPSVPTRNIRVSDIRISSAETRELPVIIGAEGSYYSGYDDLGDFLVNWKRCLFKKEGRTSNKLAGEILDYSRELYSGAMDNSQLILPLISYYGTGRLWLQKRDRPNRLDRIYRFHDARLAGYVDCLDPRSSLHLLMDWLHDKKVYTKLHGVAPTALSVVERALAICLEDWGEFEFDQWHHRFVLHAKDGKLIPYQSLSDGLRTMLGLVADIAFRVAQLNPHLGAEATAKTPGIVLIDEIDLHLHPRWQRRVVADLKKAFPQVQFIATTHSPFIIQSLDQGELHSLDKTVQDQYHDKSIEDISEYIMGVEIPQRSEHFIAMLDTATEYYRLLELAETERSDIELKRISERLDELSLRYSDNIAYHAFLRLQRIAQDKV